MGIIRKTVSIGTLGIVPFRSKKEQLRRAEKAHREAEAELAGEQAARAEVDKRLAEAEKRARQAELLALQQAKKADVAERQAQGPRREARPRTPWRRSRTSSPRPPRRWRSAPRS